MVWLLLACARAIPPALQIEATGPVPEAPEPPDPAAKVAWMVGNDPLVRRPRLPQADVPEPLAPYVEVALREGAHPQDWWAVESAHHGTLAVPFARGARLAALETSLQDPANALAWALPLAPPSGVAAEGSVRTPLAWLGVEKADALLPIAERQVLVGWLDGPGVDAGPATEALRTPTYDRLALTPAGRLLLARGDAAKDPAAGAEGRTLLEEATWLAAMQVAADRDAEQARFRQVRAEVATRLGVQGDPLPALLSRADERLVRDAANPASTAGALLAQAALRWTGGCPDKPCGGMDRVLAMDPPARWDPGVGALAAAWKVVALKAATERLEVAYDTSSFPDAMDDVVEALVATGTGALDRSVLLRARPDVTVNLALSRAAGGGDLTTKEEMLRALETRVGALARETAARAPERLREPLDRIAKRAGS